jgi:hypothetical protein
MGRRRRRRGARRGHADGSADRNGVAVEAAVEAIGAERTCIAEQEDQLVAAETTVEMFERAAEPVRCACWGCGGAIDDRCPGRAAETTSRRGPHAPVIQRP